LIFDKVTDKNKLAPFYGPRCIYLCVVSGIFPILLFCYSWHTPWGIKREPTYFCL